MAILPNTDDLIRTDGGERAPIARGNFKIRKGVS
jgi:hypothetical protein